MREWEQRDAYLSIVRRTGRGIVPASVSISPEIWDRAPDYFEELKSKCPHVPFGSGKNTEREKESFKRDDWGCLWHYPGKYLDGQVVEHPLDDWGKWREYAVPDPAKRHDWDKLSKSLADTRKAGRVASAGSEHGFFYLKMTYLRGFENFMTDVAERRPELFELADAICDYWCKVVTKYIDLGVDMMTFGDDLGHQNALPISPASWRELIKPRLARILQPCREKGIEVYLHTDGYIVPIIADLIEIGVTVLNPQDTVNGLENLRRLAKGKVCISLDVDRQNVTYFGPPERIERHIFECIRTLGSPTGGLMLIFGAYPGTPPENVGAAILAMEKYYDWWERNA